MSKFRFKSRDVGHDVYYRGKLIGQIIPLKEATGRHCFRLGFDSSRDPRTYRGMDRAAEALYEISQLTAKSKKSKWSTEVLIVQSWAAKPAASSPM
jgi:hypothetical protein